MHISITIWDGKWCWQGRCMSEAAAADCRDMDTPCSASQHIHHALPPNTRLLLRLRDAPLADTARSCPSPSGYHEQTMRMWITIGIP